MVRHSWPHPVTALFAILLFFASAYLPPYKVDIDHWFPFVAAATAIRDGIWPYVGGYDSGYGLLCPAFLAAWISWFGLSALSLSALIMASNVVAGAATFALIRDLTQSRVVALLGALYPLQGIGEFVVSGSRVFAVSSTFRAPVQIALCGLLLYASLRRGRGALLAGFLFGVMVLWDVQFGGFAAAGFLFAHCALLLRAEPGERWKSTFTILSMLAGTALSLAIIWVANSAAASSPIETYRRISSTGTLFLAGYSNAAQRFDPAVILACVVGALYLSLILRRGSRARSYTRRRLFVGASLIAAFPYGLYALGHSDALHYLPAYWALMPSAAFLLYAFMRATIRSSGSIAEAPAAARMRFARAGVAAGLITVAYAWGWFPLDRVFTADNFSARHQLERKLTREDRPLGAYLKEASQSLWQAKHLGFDAALLVACKQGLVVLSYADAWIYATGECRSPLRIASASFLSTNAEFERLVSLLEREKQIVFDPSHNAYTFWRGEILGEVKARLLRNGFAETAGCGRFSVLSKEDPAPILRRLCS